MNIELLNTQYKTKKTSERPQFLKQHITVKTYIPIEKKIESIVNMANELIHDNEHGMKEYNSIDKFITYVLTVTELYTDIELTGEHMKDFDYLMQNDLFAEINQLIGTDVNNFNELVNMKWSDVMAFNNSMEAIVSREIFELKQGIQLFNDALDMFDISNLIK